MKEEFMREALIEARKARALGEVPVGCVIADDNGIVSRGCNTRETNKNALCHAEADAISRACAKLGRRRLSDCDIYVTLEPCPMCAGAIINACMRTLYFGAYDVNSGCAGSVVDLFALNMCNHSVFVRGGILDSECAEIMKDFFAEKRGNRQKSRERGN